MGSLNFSSNKRTNKKSKWKILLTIILLIIAFIGYQIITDERSFTSEQLAEALEIDGTSDDINETFDDEFEKKLEVIHRPFDIKKDSALVGKKGGVAYVLGLKSEDAQSLIDIDPDLQDLKKGQSLDFDVNYNNDVLKLHWFISEKEERIYVKDKTGFKREVHKKKGVWKEIVLDSTIKGSLQSTLIEQGFSHNYVKKFVANLKWNKFLKKLHYGDQVKILVDQEFVKDGKIEKRIGDGVIKALKITHKKQDYYAIQAKNGNYYSKDGGLLGEVEFLRYPFYGKTRITSGFNPHRRHPITGKIRSHKGVDFALKTGTNILAPADGIILTTSYQAGGAGRYIRLKHDSKYKTIYMHLSKILVKQGQRVKRGDIIAKSGNSGRSTGPHLHYEFHINNIPHNPMTVRLPGADIFSKLSGSEKNRFKRVSSQVVKTLK